MDLQQQYDQSKLKVEALENIVRGLSTLSMMEEFDGLGVAGQLRMYSMALAPAKNEHEAIALKSAVSLAEA